MEYGWWNNIKDFIGFEKGCDRKKAVTGKKVHLELALTRAKKTKVRIQGQAYFDHKTLTLNVSENFKINASAMKSFQ